MGAIVVCGAGVIGLSATIMLARDGHQVTVLEADPAGAPSAPGGAWTSWSGKGVAQFRQPHNLFARFRQVCDEELEAIEQLGRQAPPPVPGPGRPDLLQILSRDRG